MPGIRLQLATAARAHTARGDGARDLAPLDAALLAWLALEGPTTRARLAQLVWPDKELDGARNLLRQRLFKLRHLLGADIVVGKATLALADGVTHDLADADAVLGDSAAPADGEFAHWLATQRERRRSRLRQSLVELSQMAEGARDFDDALQHAHELLALEPLSEEAHRRVMRLHYLQGDRAAALLAFDACERVLKDEVGAAPDATTLSLLRQIESSSLPTAMPAGLALPLAILRPPRLVGRELEWRQLERAWAEERVVWLRGEGGMGKSRLLNDFALARRLDGAPTLVVGARPGDAALPYALLCRLLRQVRAAYPAELSEVLRAELARLLPELGASPASSDASQLPFAIETLMDQAARQGLRAVAVDDLQWADRASVEALQPMCAATGLRWIVALRPVEAERPVQALRDALADAHRLAFVDLEPLNVDAVAVLLDSLALPDLDAARSAPALHRRCGGNPLLLLECLKAGWRRDGADALASPAAGRLIEQRLLRLSPLALRLARCAAIAGQDFDAALAASVLRLTPLELTDAWVELESAQVLSDSHFAHDLVFEAVLASVPEPIARELHAEIAQWLETQGREAARIAAHWTRGGRPLQALPHLRQAARVAATQGRNAEAADGYAQASRIAEASGDAFSALLDHIRSVEVRSRFDVLTPADADRSRALARDERGHAYALMMRAELAVFERRNRESLAFAIEASDLARRLGLAEVEAECEWVCCVARWEAREASAAMEHGARSLALWRGLDPNACCLDARNRVRQLERAEGVMLTSLGRFAEAQRRLETVVNTLASDEERIEMIDTVRDLLLGALELGAPAQAADWASRLAQLAHDIRQPPHDAAIRENALARWSAAAGRWRDAVDRFDAVDAIVQVHGHRQSEFLTFWRTGFECELGRRDLALRRLRSLRTSGSRHEVLDLAIEVASASAGEPHDVGSLLERVAMVQDMTWRLRLLLRLAPRCEPTGLLPALALAAGAAREGGALGYWVAAQAQRGLALLRAGRHDEAAQTAWQAWAQVEQGVMPVALFPGFAAEVAHALAGSRPEAAQAVARRGWQALLESAKDLPQAYRSACLDRSEMSLHLRRLSADALPP